MQAYIKSSRFSFTSDKGRTLLILSLLLTLLLTAGCGNQNISFFEDDSEEELGVPVGELIINGMDRYNVGDYFMAVKYFDKILESYPFSPEAVLAELKIADAQYYMGRYVEAEIHYSDFEERHPTNEAIPYVMYQKGMCNYKRLDRIDRDITGATDSIKQFSQLIRAYPNSPYTEEAKARIRAANEFLVHHEYLVVKFYLRTEKYSQAETRLRYLINMYPDSTIAPKAQELLTLIENEEPPTSDWSSWFPSFSLPSWTLFTDEEDQDVDVEDKPAEAAEDIIESNL